MKKNDFVVFAIFDFIYLVTSCLAAQVVTGLVIKIANSFVEIGDPGDRIIRIIVLSLGTVFLLAFVAYRDGYRYANISAGTSVTAALLAGVVHLGLGVATGFLPLLSGPTKYISSLFYAGEQIHLWYALAAGSLMLLVYAATIVLAGRIGCRNRLRDREETVKGQSASI